MNHPRNLRSELVGVVVLIVLVALPLGCPSVKPEKGLVVKIDAYDIAKGKTENTLLGNFGPPARPAAAETRAALLAFHAATAEVIEVEKLADAWRGQEKLATFPNEVELTLEQARDETGWPSDLTPEDEAEVFTIGFRNAVREYLIEGGETVR